MLVPGREVSVVFVYVKSPARRDEGRILKLPLRRDIPDP